MTSIAYRASARTNATGTASSSISIAKPAGTVQDDVMVAAIAGQFDQPITAPSGWTLQESSSSLALRVYTKVAGASEPSSYSWSWSGINMRSEGAIAAYSGVDTSAVVNVSSINSDAASTIVASSVTTTEPNCMVVTIHATDAGNSIATPSGTTLRSNDSTSSTPQLQVADFVQESAGATGDVSASSSSAGNCAASLVALTGANVAPNAPTGLSPSSSATIDKDTTQRFSWTFSDPDPGDTQSKYDLRYRPNDGVSAWTTVTASTPNAYHDFAAGTFTAGDWEWQVRTYDALGVVGPYSASAFFTAAANPDPPTITDPINNGTINTDPYTVTWSTPDQDAYQLRTVADDGAGNPDTATVYTDTGEVASTSARSASVAFATNGRVEHVQVRTQDTGLWSDWASVKVTVSYTAPAQPTIAVVADIPAGAITVEATPTAPTGSQPTVTSVDWWRRRLLYDADGLFTGYDENEGGEAGIPLERGSGLTPPAQFTDWQIGSDATYGYAARAWGDNGVSIWSEWTTEGGEITEIIDGGDATSTYDSLLTLDGGNA